MTGNSNGAFKRIPVNSDNVPEQIKQTIGRLIVVNSGETEPAKKIHYMSALISQVRSAVMMIMVKSQTTEFADLMSDLVENLLKAEYDPESIDRVIAVWKKHFDSYPRTRYDIKLMSDVALIEQCRYRWHRANKSYADSDISWIQSNAMLSDLMDTLVGICARWDLIIIPKDAVFDISSLTQKFSQQPGHHEDHE